jgi:hypothetical protein
MNDVYHSPDKHDLTVLGELDEQDLSWEFRMLVVWKRGADGALFYATDSGCSCPSPFEDFHSVDALTPIVRETLADFEREVSAFPADAVERADLLRKVRAG